MLKEKLAQRHLKKARKKQRSSSLETVIVVSDTGLTVQYWDPDDPPYGVDWDFSHYGGPQIFYKSPSGDLYANPIKIDFDEDDEQALFKVSQEYKRTMNTAIPSKIVQAMDEYAEEDPVEKLVKFNILLSMTIAGVVGFMVM